MSQGPTKVIVAALVDDLLIAVTKFIAAAINGNRVLLLFGLKQAIESLTRRIKQAYPQIKRVFIEAETFHPAAAGPEDR